MCGEYFQCVVELDNGWEKANGFVGRIAIASKLGYVTRHNETISMETDDVLDRPTEERE